MTHRVAVDVEGKSRISPRRPELTGRIRAEAGRRFRLLRGAGLNALLATRTVTGRAWVIVAQRLRNRLLRLPAWRGGDG